MKKEKGSLLKSEDFYISIFMLIVSGIIIREIMSISIPESRLMPFIILILTGLPGLVLLRNALTNKTGETARSLLFSKKELIMIIMLSIGYFLVGVVGFYSSAFLLSLGISILIEEQFDRSKMSKVLIYNIGLIVISYAVFTKILQINFPRGFFI